MVYLSSLIYKLTKTVCNVNIHAKSVHNLDVCGYHKKPVELLMEAMWRFITNSRYTCTDVDLMTYNLWLYIEYRLTTRPEDGSMQSAKYPAPVNLEQISFARSTNYK